MHILEQLGLALGLATLAGVNLYLTVLVTGLAVRFDLLHLAQQYQSLEVLGHPIVLIVAGLLFIMEFFADKIPWVDSLWDSVHTFIRPVGGVLLGLQAVGEMPVYVQVAAALIAGGAAITTHTAKAGTRLAVNHSPEPVSNVTLSVAEDAGVVGGVALTLLHPVIALGVFTLILIGLWIVLPRLWRSSRTTLWLVWHKLKMPGRPMPLTDPVDLKRVMDDTLRDILRIYGNIDAADVKTSVRCISARCKGIRGLPPNLGGVLVTTSTNGTLYFAASKGFTSRLFKIPLAGASVTVDSRFLSENLVVDGPSSRAVFRFHRGQGDIAQTVALHLKELAARHPVEEASPAKPEPEPSPAPAPVAAQAPAPAPAPAQSFTTAPETIPTPAPLLVAEPMPALALTKEKDDDTGGESAPSRDENQEGGEEETSPAPHALPATT